MSDLSDLFKIERERAALEKQRDKYRSLLGNLLAIIHRDGGHYESEHGADKATEDARTAICGLRQAMEELLAAAKETFAEFMYYRPQGGEFPMLGGRRADDVEAKCGAAITKAESILKL